MTSINEYMNFCVNHFEPIDWEPVDGHHPFNTKIKTCPGLKRALNQNDIGKQCVRVYPEKLDNGNFSWSYIPTLDESIEQKIENVSAKLIEFDDKSVTLESKIFRSTYKSHTANDGYWISVEEYLAYIKSNTNINL